MTRTALVVPVLAVIVAAGACTTDDGDDAASEPMIETVSTRADMVTGGDVLVAVALPDGASPDDVSVSIDGSATDVDFGAGEDGTAVGLVEGLPDGESTIEATAGDDTGSLDVVNHPITGPIFSGPHLPLPVCTTELNGLGPPTDDHCSAEPVTTQRWVDAEGTWTDVTEATGIPPDAVTLDDGTPLVVERHVGTINRAIYWIDVPEQWNGRLVYQFGGGCGTGYTQGFRLLADASPDLLAAGFATATATFNTFQVMCNAVLSAETAMMVKEHFAETVGVPDVTIGQGGSGGAIQQYLIVQSYPGILDAAAMTVPFPDAVSIAGDVLDCALFMRYFAEAGAEWTPEEQLAVQGHLDAGTCTFWDATFAGNVHPSDACSLGLLSAARGSVGGLTEEIPALAPEDIYDPDTNPDGLRCTLQDGNVHQLGTDPETGFALRPWDNVGTQYGLAALNEGAITVEQFLDLNERIGSFSIDGEPVEDRAEAPRAGLEAVYEAGGVIEGGGDLRRIPIITVDIYTDDIGDIHTRDRAFAVRERLRTEDGDDPPNHMLWTRPVPTDSGLVEALTGVTGVTGDTDLGLGVIEMLDEWATALADATGEEEEALESTRPEAAVDNCVDPDGQVHRGLDVYDEDNACTEAFPVSRSPRVVAGASLRNDVVKCQLQSVEDAVDAGLYEVELTDAQRDRLETIFPDGVCDYSRPGVGHEPLADTWLRYPR